MRTNGSSKIVEHRRVGSIDCMVMGSGPPLVLLPGLAPENRAPVGAIRNGEIQTMALFAGQFTTYWVGRPTGLRRGTTFAEITAQTADLLRDTFAAPVNVVGISTGGSIAQQLAAGHPEVVRRLVLMSSGGRLDGHAAATQQLAIRIVERGRPRLAMAAFGWDVLPPWRGRIPAAILMYAFGLRLYPGARDLRDFHAVLVAEAGFDLRAVPTITAETLIINGGRDRFYRPAIVEETARLIPASRLFVLPDRGHINVVSDPRAVSEAITFLCE